jgi:hypothetical protein
LSDIEQTYLRAWQGQLIAGEPRIAAARRFEQLDFEPPPEQRRKPTPADLFARATRERRRRMRKKAMDFLADSG